MLPVVILDDDISYAQLLAERFSSAAEESGMQFELRLCEQTPQAVLSYAAEHPEKSLYLLDIELNDAMDGVAVARQLHQLDPGCHVVFVSAYEQYVWSAIHAHVFDFLLKPLTDEALHACLTMLKRALANQMPAQQVILVKSGSRTLMLDQREIEYLQVDENCMTAKLTDGTSQRWYGSLKQLLPLLTPDAFVQVNRKQLVQTCQIRELNAAEGECVLHSGTRLQLSRRRMGQLRRLLSGGEVRA